MCGQYYVTVILHLKYSKIITFSMRTGQTKLSPENFQWGGGGGVFLISKIKTV